MAAGGGLLRLPHRIPYQKALELALTGDNFTADNQRTLELAELEEAFAADGAAVLAATPSDWHDTEDRYGLEETVRFPILTDVQERRRITAIIDPGGVIGHVGLRRSARETLAALEAQLTPFASAA